LKTTKKPLRERLFLFLTEPVLVHQFTFF